MKKSKTKKSQKPTQPTREPVCISCKTPVPKAEHEEMKDFLAIFRFEAMHSACARDLMRRVREAREAREEREARAARAEEEALVEWDVPYSQPESERRKN